MNSTCIRPNPPALTRNAKELLAHLYALLASHHIERDFLARHIETSDPYDVEAQRIRPRYEALRETLRGSLREVRVFRLGSVEVRCCVVGEDGRGNLAGVETVAVET